MVSCRCPPGFREAWRAFADGGWTSLAFPKAYGGQELPRLVNAAAAELWTAANLSFQNCPLLTQGAIDAILHHGTEAQRRTYGHPPDQRRVDRRHVPDRAAGGLGRRRPAHPGGARRRPLPDLRHQDLHHLRRARPRREHRPSRPGPARRRTRRHQGHLAVHRAQVPARRRRPRPAGATTCAASRSSTSLGCARARPASSPMATTTARKASCSARKTRACAACSR